jgi:hypothetical protein
LLCESNKEHFSRFHSVSITKFEGVTVEKYKIKSEGQITELNYLPEHTNTPKGVLALRLNVLNVKIKRTKAEAVRFGLTNFKFCGTTPYSITPHKGVLSLPLELNDGIKTFNISIIPIENYNKIIRKVSTLKGIEVTCEALVEYGGNDGIKQLNETIDGLCRVMSLARGTKIQWIYSDFYDKKGICIRRIHHAHIPSHIVH